MLIHRQGAQKISREIHNLLGVVEGWRRHFLGALNALKTTSQDRYRLSACRFNAACDKITKMAAEMQFPLLYTRATKTWFQHSH